MPSLGEAPSGGAKTFWLLLGRLPKVTRCKSGTLGGRYRSNGYVRNLRLALSLTDNLPNSPNKGFGRLTTADRVLIVKHNRRH